ncbi:2,3-diketo-L-gulonate reductase [Clostridiales bacterium CHKCI001]|nr:2,3-diketo-L-gulonate reductase [Clostridiales bacterium CHKCI001]
MRVQYEDLLAKFERILESRGLKKEHAHAAAVVFAQNSLDGIYSHRVNRFPRVVRYLEKGEIDPYATPECEVQHGSNGER